MSTMLPKGGGKVQKPGGGGGFLGSLVSALNIDVGKLLGGVARSIIDHIRDRKPAEPLPSAAPPPKPAETKPGTSDIAIPLIVVLAVLFLVGCALKPAVIDIVDRLDCRALGCAQGERCVPTSTNAGPLIHICMPIPPSPPPASPSPIVVASPSPVATASPTTPPSPGGCQEPTAVRMAQTISDEDTRILSGGEARRLVVRLAVDQPMACRDEQDRRGEVPLWWYAQYPGTTCSRASSGDQNQCGVEHPSRLCTREEQAEDEARGLPAAACRRADAFAGADVVGEHGGATGVVTFCAAPRAHRLADAPRAHRLAEASCASFYRDVRGVRPAGEGEPQPKPSATPPPGPDVCRTLPHEPVRPMTEEKCRDRGPGWERLWGKNGEPLCIAASSCVPGSPRTASGECPIDPAQMDGKTECRSFVEAMLDGLGKGHQTISADGYILDEGRGKFDACGYRYQEAPDVSRNTQLYDWRWMGWCPPVPLAAGGNPSGGPSPKPSPAGAREGFVPCPAHPELLCPIEGTCPTDEVARAAGQPEKWLHAPTAVGLGDRPQTQNGARVNLNTTPRDDPPYVPHRGNKGPSEQWGPCSDAFVAANGPPPMWCEGPAGRFEPAVGGSPYNRFIRLGENGPPGHYICGVRPHGARLGEKETVREYDLDFKE